MNIQTMEEGGVLGRQAGENNHNHIQEDSKKSNLTKWGLILLNYTFCAIGNTGGPMLTRLYYLHGGNRKWMYSWLQVVGFPLLLVPITILYLRDRKSGVKKNLASPKLMGLSVAIGVMTGILCLTYSYGLSVLPISTVTLIMATNLAFTALFAWLIVRQKFTPFSINSIVLMTLGAVLLGTGKNSDRLPGVSNDQYLLGFLLTILTAALSGLMLPCSEYAYDKKTKATTYSVVLQYVFCVNFIATIFCTIGMLIKKDFAAIPREASEFGLGVAKYYIILASSVIIWPMLTLGSLGLAYCTSSLNAGVFGALLLPIAEVASVIAFHEKFTREKGLSLVLCLWGFTSYFYGAYKDNKKLKPKPLET